MRPAARSETELPYFTYPNFDAPDSAARAAQHTSVAWAIVGAGPIAMTAALALTSPAHP